MERKQTIYSSKIKNLITKFYYKKNRLCFQILLNCEEDETKLYREYDDYTQYKAAYDNLLNVKATNEFVLIPREGARKMHLNFM